jgi:hypothetical protein
MTEPPSTLRKLARLEREVADLRNHLKTVDELIAVGQIMRENVWAYVATREMCARDWDEAYNVYRGETIALGRQDTSPPST